MKTFGEIIHELRKEKKETLQEVANGVGSSKSHIWEIEKGKSNNPTLSILRGFAEYFDVKVSYLIGEEVNDNKDLIVFSKLGKEEYKLLKLLAKRLTKEVK